MAHRVGERLRCEDCGAEITYTKACHCPADEPGHSMRCCGQEMRVVEGTTRGEKRGSATAHHPQARHHR